MSRSKTSTRELWLQQAILALTLGMKGPMRSSCAGPELKARLKQLADGLGVNTRNWRAAFAISAFPSGP